METQARKPKTSGSTDKFALSTVSATRGVAMTVFSVVALLLIASPASAQKQWLTSFSDSGGTHVYFQSGSNDLFDLVQIWQGYVQWWSGDMNQLSVSGCGTSNAGYADDSYYNRPPSVISPVLSYADSTISSPNSTPGGQEVLYIADYHPKRYIGIERHVRRLSVLPCGAATEDLSLLAASVGASRGFQIPADPDGKSLAGFSDDRGEQLYYTGWDGHVYHIMWQIWCPGCIYAEDLTLMAGLTPNLACSVVHSTLTAFSDTRSSPNIELVYYVGGSGHLCELAWYQGGEHLYDLTEMCASVCQDGAPQPVQNSPLTGFTDADGQHVFYISVVPGAPLGHVSEFTAGPNGLNNLDLTVRTAGSCWTQICEPPVPDSLTSFSNIWGPQVFFVDSSHHVNQIDVKSFTRTDLTASFGGALVGSSLSSTFDPWRVHVFYIGRDRHPWELIFANTWAPVDLSKNGLPICLHPETVGYITNPSTNNVSIIDTNINTVVGTVWVGQTPYGVAVTPNGNRAYVTNFTDGTVSVIDTASNSVVAVPSVGRGPLGAAVHPNGSRVYVANSSDNTVSVIDTATNTVVGQPIPVGKTPYGVVVAPNGNRVYVTNRLDGGPLGGTVSVIDTASNSVVATVPVGKLPYGVVWAVTNNGPALYVVNQGDNTVSVIDPLVGFVVATVTVGFYPAGIAVTPDGREVYVANEGDNTVSVIGTATNTVFATVPVGSAPLGVAVTPDGNRALVTNFAGQSVSMIDTTVVSRSSGVVSNAVVATDPWGTSPVAFGNFITVVR